MQRFRKLMGLLSMLMIAQALGATGAAAELQNKIAGKTRIVFIAGPSHDYAEHEYFLAGCLLLAKCLRRPAQGRHGGAS